MRTIVVWALALITALPITVLPVAAEVIPSLHDALPKEYKDGINIAVFNDWPPDEFIEDGELKGWSVDIAHEMEDRLGVKFNFMPTSFDAIVPGLVAKRFDAGFSSFGTTAERLKSLDFVSQRKIGTAFGIKKNSDVQIKTESDACGVSVTVISGAWDHQLLEKLNEEHCVSKGLVPVDIQGHSNQAQAELAVRSGRAEATFASSAKMAYLAQQTGEFRVSELLLSPVNSCIGLRKDDPLAQVMTDAIQTMIDDGTYLKIMEKWNLADDGMLEKALLITEKNPADI